MLGDTAVAVHPDDERYKHLIGKHAILPLVGRRIPIVADEYSDPEKGTGAVKITPAHDFNDFEVGRRHDLPLINVLDREANLNLENNDAFLDGLDPMSPELVETLQMHGIDRFVARRLIVERMQDRGLVAKIEPHVNMVPHGDRSGVIIEPYLTDQWYVDAKTLAQPAAQAVRDGRTTFVPQQWEATYFNWMDNIQPWCISRQLWWGHQNSGVVRLGARQRRPVVDREDGSVRRRDRGGSAAARQELLQEGCRAGRQHGRQPGQGRPGRQAAREDSGLARRGRARHLVLVGAVAVLDARLAVRDRRSSSASIRPTCW